MKCCRLSENYLRSYLKDIRPPYCLLETIASDQENYTSYFFSDFIDILTFKPKDKPKVFFRKIQNYINKGYWLCGYFNYEFGYCLEPRLGPLLGKNNTNLAWLGVCRRPIVIYNKKGEISSQGAGNNGYKIKNIKPNISKKEYSNKIKKIKYYLSEGLTYQVNYTFKVKFDFKGDPLGLYLDLRRAQPTAYAALINTEEESILSFSPELFFRTDKEKITTRPMKGTSDRGQTKENDKVAKEFLRQSKKIKAENLMIVDLLRNDLGRVAKKVRVPKLFEVEKHRTLFQMTSTISARLEKNIKQKDIFYSLFPCGSVTGAPKIKTMQLIKKLEKEQRGVYTGAIGYISPKQKSCFNVAIRTINLQNNRGEIGIGGGIVYDSQHRSEHEEALLKAKFFMGGFSKMALIESILWQKRKEFYLLDLHIRRLKNSCEHFLIPLNLKALKKKLRKVIDGEDEKLKIRVLVDIDGRITTEKEKINDIKQPVRIRLSSRRVDLNNRFLYHKTTQRSFYDREKREANRKGFFDVIFLNKKEQITEGSITNVFILKNKNLCTPPLDCGLLPGVLREHLLITGKAKEKILYLKDIKEADKVYIGNSVRGLLEAKLK